MWREGFPTQCMSTSREHQKKRQNGTIAKAADSAKVDVRVVVRKSSAGSSAKDFGRWRKLLRG